MELADPSSIAALISNSQYAEAPEMRKADVRRTSTRTTKSRRSCQCGVCTSCQDNAKWERIFSEKFADADYYKPRPVWGGSSLGWLRSV